jgi:hypothetical protein
VPWHAYRIAGGYVVRDANGQALAYIYSRDNEAEALQAKVLTKDEAWRIVNITRLPGHNATHRRHNGMVRPLLLGLRNGQQRRRSDLTVARGHGRRVAMPPTAAPVGYRSISRNPPFG